MSHFKAVVESNVFWVFFASLDDDTKVEVELDFDNNINKVIESDNGVLVSDFKKANFKFQELNERQAELQAELQEVVLKLAKDRYNYLKTVTDYENKDSLIDLGCALIDISLYTHYDALTYANAPIGLNPHNHRFTFKEAFKRNENETMTQVYLETTDAIINEINQEVYK